MAKIRMFRVNSGDVVTKGMEFYYKIEDDEGKVLCNLCIGDDGISYYRPKSRILSRDENKRTRATADGYITMEELTHLFEALKIAHLDSEGADYQITRQRNKVVIEKGKALLE